MAKGVLVLAVLALLQSSAFLQNSQFLAMASTSVAPLVGDQPVIDQPKDAQGSGSLGVLPATFIGDFRCADCDGIRYQLNLFPDHFFLSRMIYQGRSNTFDDLWTWEVTTDGKTLRLTSSSIRGACVRVVSCRSRLAAGRSETKPNDIAAKHDVTRITGTHS